MLFINTFNKTITKTLTSDALDFYEDRKSEVLVMGKKTFLLTGGYSRDRNSQNLTYISIYVINSQHRTMDFVNIIDGWQLGLDSDIMISDFDVLKNSTIVVHDLSKSQLILVEYTLSNQVSRVGEPWIYGSEGVEIEVTTTNTVLIANKKYV